MMTQAMDLAGLAPAWAKVQAHAPARLQAITSEKHYRAMIKFMNGMLDEIGDSETHPLMGLLDIVTAFVADYEERHEQLPDASPAQILRLLMDQHDLKQADLADLFGAQSNVSDILNGKREINARQARALAARFGVSTAAFI
ncbi:MAG: helix-turn-helix domain-containing protein [Pseudomonadota bacterium]